MRDFASYLRFLSVAVIGLLFDLWSKYWAFNTMGQASPPRVVVPHVLEFQTMMNPGALFGIGGGQTLLFLAASACALLLVFWMFSQTTSRRWALQIALGGILAGALGNMYDRITVKLIEKPYHTQDSRFVYLENLGKIDEALLVREYSSHEKPFRIALEPEDTPPDVGFVRDFIKIPTTTPNWEWLPERIRAKELWPWVFNVADMLLVGGVAILAIHLWRDRKHERQAESENEPPQPDSVAKTPQSTDTPTTAA